MLPTKKYYRLEEVANRWNCAVDDLLYWAEEGKLAIALPPEPITDQFYYIVNPRDFSKTLSGTNESDVVLVALTPERARHLFTDTDGNILSEEALEAMSEAEFREAELRFSREQRLRLAPGYLEHKRFTTDNLLITDEELERFEWENKIGHDHRFGHSNEQISDRGMWNQLRLKKKIDDLKQQWDLLNEKLNGLNEQWILETRFEEKLRLRKLIDDTKTQRDRVEEQLKDMESQLAKADSDAKEGAGRNDDHSSA